MSIATTALIGSDAKKTWRKKMEKVVKVGIKKEPGYLYYVDKAGDISRSKMSRSGRPRKA